MGLNGPHEIAIYDDTEMVMCKANLKTHSWSMKKLAWFAFNNQPKLPSNFSMISGCGLALERSKALLIGGHRKSKLWENDFPYFPDTNAPNDQVLMYDFVRQSWTWIRNIPFHSIRPLELKCSVVFNKNFKT